MSPATGQPPGRDARPAPQAGAVALLPGADGVVVGRVARPRGTQGRVETPHGVRPWPVQGVALPLRATSVTEATQLVAALRRELTPLALREALQTLGEATGVSTLAQLLLDREDAAARAAVITAAVDEDDTVTLDGHIARLRSEAERVAHRHARAAQVADERALAALHIAQRELKTLGMTTAPPDPALVHVLERLARGGPPPSPDWAAALSPRASDRRGLATGAARALANLGVWDGHEDAALLRSGLLAPWPADALAAIPSAPQWPARRCALAFRAIDSLDPHEIDDALHAAWDGDDVALTVAIASPALWVAAGSAVDRRARRQGSTVYHPRHTVPMLPGAVSEAASLTPGGARPALVFELRIPPEGPASLRSCYEATVSVTEALTYDQVDHALAQPEPAPWLTALRAAAERGEASRIANGAYLLYRADIEVRAATHEPPVLRPAPQSSLARRLVAESMVQTCATVARWARDRALALPYRTQRIRPDPPLPPGLYTEPADVQTMLGHLGAARAGPQAGRHDILGVDAYVQVTSPLRRYADLLAHQQLLAHLRGDPPPRSGAEITAVMAEQRAAVRQARAHAKRGQRYFQLLALAREGLGASVRAQVVRAGSGGGRNIAVDVDRVLEIELPGYLGPVGTWLDLKVTEVDAGDGRVRVAPAA